MATRGEEVSIGFVELAPLRIRDLGKLAISENCPLVMVNVTEHTFAGWSKVIHQSNSSGDQTAV